MKPNRKELEMARIYLGNVKGPQGATGATGATGPQGEAATIEVGSVSTTAYGNAAQVTNVGSPSAAKFNFVIPQGKPGEKTTKMGELTLDTITTSVEEFPSPAVGDTGATVFGKIVKFFSDVLASLTNKIDVSKIANDFTTTDASYVAAAPTVKALNDSLTNIGTIYSNYGSTAVSVNSWTAGVSVSIPAGTYIGIYEAYSTTGTIRAGSSNVTGDWVESSSAYSMAEHIRIFTRSSAGEEKCYLYTSTAGTYHHRVFQ